MRDELIKKYEDLYGVKPHHKLNDENIQKAIDNFSPNLPKGEPVESEKDDKITLSRAELQHMIKEAMENKTPDLRESSDWKEMVENKDNKTARMRLYREDTNADFGLVLDKKLLKYEYDEDTRKRDKAIYEVTVLYPGGEKKILIPLAEYIEINDFETVIILETESKKLVKSFGKIRQTMKDKSGYSRSSFPGAGGSVNNKDFLGDFVDQNVVRIESFHTIKRPDGSTLKVHNNQLNG